MADAKKCDRCDALYAPADLARNTYYVRWENGFKGTRIDLCPSCLEAMKRFLKMEPIDIYTETNITGRIYTNACGAKHCHKHKE